MSTAPLAEGPSAGRAYPTRTIDRPGVPLTVVVEMPHAGREDLFVGGVGARRFDVCLWAAARGRARVGWARVRAADHHDRDGEDCERYKAAAVHGCLRTGNESMQARTGRS